MHSLTVTKIGGAKLAEPDFLEQLVHYATSLRKAGKALVIVHGGGPQIEQLHKDLDVPYEKIAGLRVTTQRSMPLVTQILCGSANKHLVATFVKAGIPAFGLSGVDGGFIRSSLLDQATYGRVGNDPQVDLRPLTTLVDANFLPVIAPVCLGTDGEPLNVNADSVALSVAIALKAETLEFVSDIEGVKTPNGIARQLDPRAIKSLIESSVVIGGMIPKLMAAADAAQRGVTCVRIGSLQGMLTGTATEIVKERLFEESAPS